MFENIAVDLQKYVSSINLSGGTEVNANLGVIGKELPEHRHECGGINWPAVLPPEIIMAGRILAKSVEKRRCLGETFAHVEDLVILCGFHILYQPLVSFLLFASCEDL